MTASASRIALSSGDAEFVVVDPAASASPAAASIGEAAEVARRIGFRQAMEIARDSTALFTELRVDAVSSCERSPEGWRVVVDVIEAAARLGDNDLLASFEVILDACGECERFNRIARYHRGDAAR